MGDKRQNRLLPLWIALGREEPYIHHKLQAWSRRGGPSLSESWMLAHPLATGMLSGFLVGVFGTVLVVRGPWDAWWEVGLLFFVAAFTASTVTYRYLRLGREWSKKQGQPHRF